MATLAAPDCDTLTLAFLLPQATSTEPVRAPSPVLASTFTDREPLPLPEAGETWIQPADAEANQDSEAVTVMSLVDVSSSEKDSVAGLTERLSCGVGVTGSFPPQATSITAAPSIQRIRFICV